MITIKELISQLTPQMKQTPAEDPVRELRLIVAHVLDISYDSVFFHEEQYLTPLQIEKIKQVVALRLDHMPLAKIIGKKEFWGLSFSVTNDTLDPRPESETLIEEILEIFPDKNQSLRILDLGTGTGCLLLSSLNEYVYSQGIGIDISQKALDVAQENARNLGIDLRCFFLQGSWFEPLDHLKDPFDLIISNPPYISPETLLSQETLHDPELALFAPEKGLLYYRLILEQSQPFLSESGCIVFEIGANQQDDVVHIALQNGYALFSSRKDLLGHVRCLVFKKS